MAWLNIIGLGFGSVQFKFDLLQTGQAETELLPIPSGYESKEGILGIYTLQFVSFHLSAVGLHLYANHHIN